MIWNNLRKFIFRYTLFSGYSSDGEFDRPVKVPDTRAEAVANNLLIVGTTPTLVHDISNVSPNVDTYKNANIVFITTDFDNSTLELTGTSSTIKSTTNTGNIDVNNQVASFSATYSNDTTENVVLYGYIVSKAILTAKVGIIGGLWSSSSSSSKPIPIASIKFNSPVTIEPGQSMSISYTIDFSDILNPQETSSIN